MQTIETITPCGKIKGIDQKDYAEYRGIRYARAKRWEYPVKVTCWEGVYDATAYGACCFQRRAFENDAVTNAFYHKEFREGQVFTYSEDCLFLNIYAPKDARDCPVLFYIHGGSFTGGSADEGHISGKEYAKRGIVFVAINYRLGPYGFCSHPSLTVDGACGNFGLYDQVAAIDWVRDNIAFFGGDPRKITLVGQSAGAMSVDLLISSPLCRDKIAGAIMMSGASIQRAAAKPLAPEKTAAFWEAAAKHIEYDEVEELRLVDERTLYYGWFAACDTEKRSILRTLPVCDGKLITRETFNMKTIPDIPLMVGITLTDMAPAALEWGTRKYVKAAAKYGKCYVYSFNRKLPGDNKGAWHAGELFYAFNTFDINWCPFEPIDFEISKQFIAAIEAFTKTGNPNCDEIPEWKPCGKQPMTFCENTGIAKWQTKELIKNTLDKEVGAF